MNELTPQVAELISGGALPIPVDPDRPPPFIPPTPPWFLPPTDGFHW